MNDSNPQSSLRSNAIGAQTAGRNGAQTAEAGRLSSAALQQNAQVAGAATRQGALAGAEAMRRAGDAAADTVRRIAPAIAEGERQISQEVGRTYQEASRKAAKAAYGASEDMRRLATLSHAAEGGLRDMQRGMAGLLEGVVQANVLATHELLRLANPIALIEMQQRLARNYTDAMLQGAAVMVRAVRRTADDTLHPLEAQVALRQQDSGLPHRS